MNVLTLFFVFGVFCIGGSMMVYDGWYNDDHLDFYPSEDALLVGMAVGFFVLVPGYILADASGMNTAISQSLQPEKTIRGVVFSPISDDEQDQILFELTCTNREMSMSVFWVPDTNDNRSLLQNGQPIRITYTPGTFYTNQSVISMSPVESFRGIECPKTQEHYFDRYWSDQQKQRYRKRNHEHSSSDP